MIRFYDGNRIEQYKSNHLYICPRCNNVWEFYMTKGEIVVDILDSEFPKRQDKKICPMCREGIFGTKEVEIVHFKDK